MVVENGGCPVVAGNEFSRNNDGLVVKTGGRPVFVANVVEKSRGRAIDVSGASSRPHCASNVVASCSVGIELQAEEASDACLQCANRLRPRLPARSQPPSTCR
ncbi:hypothetical protein DIPPA_34903 [Diplonema papillatum]|nr:hypothetical protein DIPPA_34903 [Diplonema papillatum]